MHLDSVSTLRDRASEAIKQCAITKLQGQPSQVPHTSSSDIECEIRRQATRCCYTVDILISCSTNQAVSADRFLDDEVGSCSSELETHTLTHLQVARQRELPCRSVIA